MKPMKGRSFLTLLDYSPEEISAMIDLAADLKQKKKAGIPQRLCEGRQIALIFEKTSTRTRCAFEVAAADLGMHSTYLDPKSSQIGKKSPSPTRRGSSAGCMTRSNTGASVRRSWKRSRAFPACRS